MSSPAAVNLSSCSFSSVCHRQQVNLTGKLFFFGNSEKIGGYFGPLFIVETLLAAVP